MIQIVDIFVLLLLAVAIIALLARKLHIPYPILFVIGGLSIGWLPHLPKIQLNPDLVFLVFLPPLLFSAAVGTSWRDFRANLRPISFLAVGLVLFTIVIVAWLAHHFMKLPLAAGFVLGAIISPPDAIAATAIAERLSVPRRIVTILEGESLVNDATALIAYRFAIAATLTSSFSLTNAGMQFFLVGGGGILIGLLVGWLAVQFHKRVDDASIEITMSLLTPFIAYLFAERCGGSGVLSVVTAGLYLGRRLPEIISYRTRLQGGPVWAMIEFLLNGFVFVLIGLELPDILHTLSANKDYTINQLIGYALIISVAVIVIRVLWVFPATYLPRLIIKKICAKDPYPNWRYVTIIAWTGMRGVVSLAAALALTNTFPHRDLILFLTFIVIVTTLVVQGLSLPPLIRWLGIEDDGSELKEEREARLQANRAALSRLNQIQEKNPEKAEVLQRLRIEYEDHIQQIEGEQIPGASAALRLFSSEYERLSHEALQVERSTLLQLRDANVINDEILRRVQRDIDLAEIRLK
ncbi:MAG TPA: Na+/H+ antiporter [Verrucomicrobiae bacterium]|jgi:CPA1 family monovalent cation:H+ antiporter